MNCHALERKAKNDQINNTTYRQANMSLNNVILFWSLIFNEIFNFNNYLHFQNAKSTIWWNDIYIRLNLVNTEIKMLLVVF